MSEMTKEKEKNAVTVKKTPTPAEKRKERELKRNTAKAAIRPSVNAAGIVRKYGRFLFGDSLSGVELADEIVIAMREVNGGNLTRVENILLAQAIALQSMFTNLAIRADAQDGNLDKIEPLMRMALRAQNQSRMTLETLSNVKNPPVVYARQANINNGNQQVNNGVTVPDTRTREEKTIEANEVSGGKNVKALESGATGAAFIGNPSLEAVGAVNGAKNRSREKAVIR